MQRAIFTISNSGYRRQAEVLKTSILAHHAEVEFYHFTPDSKMSCLGEGITNLTIYDLNLDPKWVENAFRELDIVEISTSIKPKAFQYLFDKGYEAVMFLDPDIYVTSNLDELFSLNEKYPILITPHLVNPPKNTDKIKFELSLLRYGTYNLGFICISNVESGRKMLDWWSTRTLLHSKRQRFLDEFTDQKWINLAAVYFECFVVKHPGCNLAPWNIFERGIARRNNIYMTRDGKPILFVHFSQSSYSDDLDCPSNLWNIYYGDYSNKDKELDSLLLLIREYRSLLFQNPGNLSQKIPKKILRGASAFVTPKALRIAIREDYTRFTNRSKSILKKLQVKLVKKA